MDRQCCTRERPPWKDSRGVYRGLRVLSKGSFPRTSLTVHSVQGVPSTSGLEGREFNYWDNIDWTPCIYYKEIRLMKYNLFFD